jgi:hypothetical protein
LDLPVGGYRRLLNRFPSNISGISIFMPSSVAGTRVRPLNAGGDRRSCAASAAISTLRNFILPGIHRGLGAASVDTHHFLHLVLLLLERGPAGRWLRAGEEPVVVPVSHARGR